MAESPYTYRQSESMGDPATDAEKAARYARWIMGQVGDPRMHPTIPTKVARAVMNRLLSPNELDELLAIIVAKRKLGELDSPGAYFTASIKRLFQRNEIPWRQRGDR